ncbi:hypothetical protein [Flavobacterium sp. LAR06]|uniref:hypothetical protein n=1 Tax=Flavobacterium sp. LAR06 TaxID=3064897 RepID=UPI0035C2481E
MKKIKLKKTTLKKMVFNKTNIMELNSNQARLIVGGSTPGEITDPRSLYSIYLAQE